MKKRDRDLVPDSSYDACLSRYEKELSKHKSRLSWNTHIGARNEACKTCPACKAAYQTLVPLIAAEEELINSLEIYNDNLQEQVVNFIACGPTSGLSRDIWLDLAQLWWYRKQKRPHISFTK